ncbi:hypothetical protein [Stenomitos frigidus]|uniref:Uncharacterized protein n=1 Tax=Stenomitos frigidus ULC18 TaxID=2107698 RepID=A0A2T1DXZ7_9CYAN|nr:hypothetical protein [Stenomitos frigidus]PSB25311.1 hypothetical protein C7B82_23520 [Stenomitos frigidus ULC18]
MITIEAIATVTPEGKVTIQLPATIPPGNHKLVLVIDEQPVTTEKRPPFDFPTHSVGAWPDNLSLRREDMYDDWGR